MLDIDVLKFATILNNIICSLVACIFLWLLRGKLTHHKVSAAGWFAAYFLLFSLAFVTTTMRGWVPIEIVVLSNNFLYQTVTYMLLFGVISWFRRPITNKLMAFAATHIIAYTCIQFWLLRQYPEHFDWRINLAAVSYSAVHLTSAWYAFSHMKKSSSGEKLLTTSLLLSSVCVFLPMFLFHQFQSAVYFLSGVVVGQNLLTVVSLGAMLSLFFYDEIEWHYHRSIHDELTGIFNRRHFMEQAANRLNNAKEAYTVAIIDVDHFKQVNDTFGHDVGDRALTAIAQLMFRHFRRDLVARYGGEEFVVLLAGSVEETRFKLERFNHEVANHAMEISGQHVDLTVSIGMASVQSDQHLQQALKQADVALYDAKGKGRNRLVSLV